MQINIVSAIFLILSYAINTCQSQSKFISGLQPYSESIKFPTEMFRALAISPPNNSHKFSTLVSNFGGFTSTPKLGRHSTLVAIPLYIRGSSSKPSMLFDFISSSLTENNQKNFDLKPKANTYLAKSVISDVPNRSQIYHSLQSFVPSVIQRYHLQQLKPKTGIQLEQQRSGSIKSDQLKQNDYSLLGSTGYTSGQKQNSISSQSQNSQSIADVGQKEGYSEYASTLDRYGMNKLSDTPRLYDTSITLSQTFDTNSEGEKSQLKNTETSLQGNSGNTYNSGETGDTFGSESGNTGISYYNSGSPSLSPSYSPSYTTSTYATYNSRDSSYNGDSSASVYNNGEVMPSFTPAYGGVTTSDSGYASPSFNNAFGNSLLLSNAVVSNSNNMANKDTGIHSSPATYNYISPSSNGLSISNYKSQSISSPLMAKSYASPVGGVYAAQENYNIPLSSSAYISGSNSNSNNYIPGVYQSVGQSSHLTSHAPNSYHPISASSGIYGPMDDGECYDGKSLHDYSTSTVPTDIQKSLITPKSTLISTVTSDESDELDASKLDLKIVHLPVSVLKRLVGSGELGLPSFQ